MFFAAKEAVERKAHERSRREGIVTARRAEHERIARILEKRGVSLPPELVKRLAGDEA